MLRTVSCFTTCHVGGGLQGVHMSALLETFVKFIYPALPFLWVPLFHLPKTKKVTGKRKELFTVYLNLNIFRHSVKSTNRPKKRARETRRTRALVSSEATRVFRSQSRWIEHVQNARATRTRKGRCATSSGKPPVTSLSRSYPSSLAPTKTLCPVCLKIWKMSLINSVKSARISFHFDPRLSRSGRKRLLLDLASKTAFQCKGLF